MSNNLERLLTEVAQGNIALAENFYRELLMSSVFVPESAQTQDKNESKPILVGQTPENAQNWILVRAENIRYLPVFTCEEYGTDWASPSRLKFSYCSIKTLLWSLNPDTHIYLNPGQDIGKEFTPWEISQLKLGSEAIPELIAELAPLPDSGIEVIKDPKRHEKLQRSLRGVLDIFPEIDEAFLLELAREERDPQLLLALAMDNTSAELSQRIETAVRNLREDSFSANDLPLSIIFDIWNSASPHRQLFISAKPFYIRQIELQKMSLAQRLLKKVDVLLRSGGSSSPTGGT
ncbi:MAG: SseB family protein [bacterium]|nr:SseB family protein [bacterium]